MREASPIIDELAGRLKGVRNRIADAARAAGRHPDGIGLIAVSKTVPAEVLRAAHGLGQDLFGESYVQEALAKIDALADLPGIVWHFIGPIQSNKTRPIAERFAWVHSVDRPKIAERLASQRPPDLPPLQVCVQVNVSGEATKAGVMPDDLPELLAAVAAQPALTLRGLMAIPEPTEDPALQSARFSTVRSLLEAQRAHYPTLDTLSMGMSDDLESAIAEGATLVRIGRAVFGERR